MLPTLLALDALVVAALAAGLGVSWYEYGQSEHNYWFKPRNSLYQEWNFESWNCAIAPHIRPGLTSVTTPMLSSLCAQAKTARILMIPALILAVIVMGVHFWAWRKHNIAMREHQGEAAPPYESRGWKLESESESQRSGGSLPVSPVSPAVAHPMARGGQAMDRGRMAEVAGAPAPRAELPMDPYAKEMMGDNGYNELSAGQVAVEKPASERYFQEKV